MRYGVPIGRRHSAVTGPGFRRDRPAATAEPVEAFAPLSEVLGEIGSTLIVLLGIAAAGYAILSALGIF
jgi:hypothetical protein